MIIVSGGHEIDLFETVFQKTPVPLVLCDEDGSRCNLNQEAEQVFSARVIGNITDLFPDLVLNHKTENLDLKDKWDRIHQIEVSYLIKEKHYLIAMRRETSDWEDFVREQKVLNRIYADLCTSHSEKDIYRKIVEWGRSELHIDRIGIILISEDKQKMLGSWGTNDRGEIIDQSHYEADLEDDKRALGAIASRDNVQVEFDRLLKNEGAEVGTGWNSLAAFFDGEDPVGWIACDNLLTHSPLPQWKKEILGELARMIGRFVSRFRQENRLQELVEQRTEELRISQKHLIESEKMAALGSLVAGVSHEINTPLGIAITANSYLSDLIENTLLSFEEGSLTKTKLIAFFNKLRESMKIIADSLSRTDEHITDFKNLAINTTSEDYALFNVKECFSSVYQLLSAEYADRNVTVQNNIDERLHFEACQSDFILIFTNLIENSFIHGFKSGGGGIIRLDSRKENETVIIDYRDNGSGINEQDLEKIFAPFYTTERHKGKAGLGLSIIYNLVYKYGGTIESRALDPGLLLSLRFTGLTQF
ncbi:MAG: HAMP domain-containing histidine kinase [Spirochaetales bacterium]|nr:HAMP domain-containing histidine kinase [Spirochaetales bacterium]